MTTYKDIAMKLFDAGYEPLPVIGKAPKYGNWSTMMIDEDQVRKWQDSGLGKHNTGIRLGEIHAIDADIYDEVVARRLAAWMDAFINDGTPLIRRFGQVPKFLVPCVLEGITSKMLSSKYVDQEGRTNAIEILATGQQFVAYGIHETTKKPYQWIHGELAEMTADKLPCFSKGDIDWLFDTFSEMAEEAGWTLKNNKKTQVEKPKRDGSDPFADYEPPPDFDTLKRAVKMLPHECWDDYEDWTMIGMAINQAANKSDAGLDLYDTNSKRSEKYPGREAIEKKWQSFDPGREEAVTFGSIYALLCHYFDEEDVQEGIYPEVNRSSDSASQPSQTSRESLLSSLVTSSSQKASQTQDISAEVDEYIHADPSNFTLQQIYQELGYQKKRQKDACRKALQRRVDSGILQKDSFKRGGYIVIDDEIEEIEWIDADEPVLPLRLPLGLSHYFNIIMGNVIVIAGATNAGKTLLAMNILRTWASQLVTVFDSPVGANNFHPSLREFVEGWPGEFVEKFSGIRYVNAEMTRSELINTVKLLGPNHKDVWDNVQWIKRNHNFHQVVLPHGITVIDYIQIYDEFYKIGAFIRDIADRLDTGLAIILIQMQRGAKVPRGGDFALERCRLGLSLDRAGPDITSCLIAKGKNVKPGAKTIQDAYIDYQFGHNAIVRPITEPVYLSDKDRQKLNMKYQQEHQAKSAKNDFEE